jgi:hypothetical protein
VSRISPDFSAEEVGLTDERGYEARRRTFVDRVRRCELLGDADFPEDPLRISPERTTPASTGNIFFRTSELTPEKFCA